MSSHAPLPTRKKVARLPPGTSSIAGATTRTEVEKPSCPQHMVKMKYDPEDLFWHCPFRGCKILARQNGDHVLASMGNYTGPVSILFDRRTGELYLRMASSSFTGSAPLILLSATRERESDVEGVDTVDIDSARRQVQIVFDDLVTVDHSARIRR